MKQNRVLILLLLILCAGAGWWQWGRRPAPKIEVPIEIPVEVPAGFTGLGEAKQKEIWDAEHVTFEIETHMGRKLVAELQKRSTDQLAGFFHAGFSGIVPQRTTPATTEKSSITETTYAVDKTGSINVDADGFSRHLIESIHAVPENAKGRFRVLQIARVQDAASADTWQLSVLLTLGGTNAAAEPITYVSSGRMRCRFSSDDDIIAGRIIESWDVDSESVRSGRNALMEEATSRVGLDRLPIKDNWTCEPEDVRQYRFQTAVEDFNSDGFLDIAVATADDQRFVLQWNPQIGQYEDVAKSLGLSNVSPTDSRSYLACWIDFDDDGDVDLILGKSLFRNVEGKTFEPVANNGGLRFAFNPMGCVVADYDGDGLLDLYVVYQRDKNTDAIRDGKPPAWVGDDDSGAFNQLWRNEGNGTFTEVTYSAKATGGKRHSFAATWLHANDDHYPDLYVANDFARNSLLINQGDGSFEDVAEDSDVGDFATSMGVASGDINGDGIPEIYVANMYSKMGRRIIAQVSAQDYPAGIYEQLVGSCAGNRMYSTQGDVREFQEVSEQLGVNAVGWAYAPAFADFDGDGSLDVYATTGFLSFDRRKPDG
ncbi:MAG TPA: VCBS repeat-containing protein [Planctomycetaceae bacterium]|nr:VCBS repeat-containing protein [Planctomycetaceae bacterium]HQZ67694.1 VCBS repeat-containing protein [Planctomycetaceae bacterium]